MGNEPVLVSWSGGKDSAMALRWVLARQPVAALLTTVTEGYERISMHGVRRELLHRQAASLGLPLEEVRIPPNASNDVYEARMGALLGVYRAKGVGLVAFGDIFLEDLRRYREGKLAGAGMGALFPLWGRNTTALAREFLASGFRATVCCVDGQALDGGFVGREFDEAFLGDLPPTVDPCGERGEFHTFVHGGPIFSEPIAFAKGERVVRDGRFHFCDLLPLGP